MCGLSVIFCEGGGFWKVSVEVMWVFEVGDDVDVFKSGCQVFVIMFELVDIVDEDVV